MGRLSLADTSEMCYYREIEQEIFMSTTKQSMALILPKSGSIESYMQSAYSIPVLTAEREHALATRLYSENDLTAAQE